MSPTLQTLADFIQNNIRMLRDRQPVILTALLDNDGKCHARDIAITRVARIGYRPNF